MKKILDKLSDYLFPPEWWQKGIAFIIFAGLLVGMAYLASILIKGAGEIASMPWLTDVSWAVIIICGLFLYGAAAWVKK